MDPRDVLHGKAPPPPKLPVWRPVREAYRAWFGNFGLLIRISWLWILFSLAPVALLNWYQAPALLTLMYQLDHGQNPGLPLGALIGGMLTHLVLLPAMASIAVAWHRLLLMDEHPRGGVYLRLDSVVMGYAGLAATRSQRRMPPWPS